MSTREEPGRSGHTPGPWRVVCGRSMFSIVGPGATLPMPGNTNYGIPSDERERNARLMAAAPELLDALRDALPYVRDAYECDFPDTQENERILILIETVIAKAEGREVTP